jgi:hypothetical protein
LFSEKARRSKLPTLSTTIYLSATFPQDVSRLHLPFFFISEG